MQEGNQRLGIEVDERCVEGGQDGGDQARPLSEQARADPIDQDAGEGADQGLDAIDQRQAATEQGEQNRQKIWIERRLPEDARSAREITTGDPSRGPEIVRPIDQRNIKIDDVTNLGDVDQPDDERKSEQEKGPAARHPRSLVQMLRLQRTSGHLPQCGERPCR